MTRRRSYRGYGYDYNPPNVESSDDPLVAAIGGALGGYSDMQESKARRREEADRKREREMDRADRDQDRADRRQDRARGHVENMNKQRREAAEQGFQYRTLEEVLPIPGVFPGAKLPPGVVSDYVKVGPSQREREITLEGELKRRTEEEKRKAEEAKALNDLKADARFLGIRDTEQMDAVTLKNVITQERDQRKRDADWQDYQRKERLQDQMIRGRRESDGEQPPKFLTPEAISTRAAELTKPTTLGGQSVAGRDPTFAADSAAAEAEVQRRAGYISEAKRLTQLFVQAQQRYASDPGKLGEAREAYDAAVARLKRRYGVE